MLAAFADLLPALDGACDCLRQIAAAALSLLSLGGLKGLLAALFAQRVLGFGNFMEEVAEHLVKVALVSHERTGSESACRAS